MVLFLQALVLGLLAAEAEVVYCHLSSMEGAGARVYELIELNYGPNREIAM